MIAAQACNEADSVEDAAFRFQNISADPLGEALALIGANWPDRFQRKYVDSDLLRIAFFAMERQCPTICILTFTVVRDSIESAHPNVATFNCPGTVPNHKSLVVTLGATDASAAFQNDQKLWDSNPLSGIKKVILAEAKARPDTVGPPIDIIRIDTDGPRWIQSKPQCRDVN